MKLSHAEGVRDPITQPTEPTQTTKRRATSRALRLGVLVSSTTLLLACGPHGGHWDGDSSDDVGGIPGTPSSGGADTGGGSSVGGGSTYECDPQPQQTYICAGTAYENELAGAAELTVYPDVCGEQFGTGGYWSSGGAGTGGSYYYGGDGGYQAGGSTSAGGTMSVGGAIWAGGAMPYPLVDSPTDGSTPEAGPIGYGGAPDGAGGADSTSGGSMYYYPSGGAAAGGANSGTGGPSKWCESDPAGTVIGGISFAVGSCQDVDVALPLLLKEPYYGSYTAHVYGSSSACDRAVLLSTVAGIGTGQVLEVPFRTEGYSFISVEVQGDRYNEFGIRLRDRPHVVPSSGK
jgi:hypothetical protein